MQCVTYQSSASSRSRPGRSGRTRTDAAASTSRRTVPASRQPRPAPPAEGTGAIDNDGQDRAGRMTNVSAPAPVVSARCSLDGPTQRSSALGWECRRCQHRGGCPRQHPRLSWSPRRRAHRPQSSLPGAQTPLRLPPNEYKGASVSETQLRACATDGGVPFMLSHSVAVTSLSARIRTVGIMAR